MSTDKQQTWAEAVVECVEDMAERSRLLQLYEPDEMAAALLRQVAIANAAKVQQQDHQKELQQAAEILREFVQNWHEFSRFKEYTDPQLNACAVKAEEFLQMHALNTKLPS